MTPLLRLTLVIALAGAIPTARAGNLLPEGSMEISGDMGMAEGFTYPDPNWLKSFAAAVSVENENGNRFIRVDMPRAEQLIACSVEIPVPEGATSLRLSWRVRALVKQLSPKDDPGGRGVCMIATWYDKPPSIGDRGYKFCGMWKEAESTRGWVARQATLAVPAGKKFLAIQFGTKNAAAIADFDDIMIEKIP
jgi:hypothetical protein